MIPPWESVAGRMSVVVFLQKNQDDALHPYASAGSRNVLAPYAA